MRRSIGLLMLAGALIAGCSAEVASHASGEEIYLQLCARCHGGDLEGQIGPPLGPGSNAAAQPDDFLVFTVEFGRGRMPSFSSKLNDVQLDRLVAYLRGVQRG